MLRSIVVFILFLSLGSCQNNDDKILMKDVGEQWKKNDVQTFDFDINDAENQKNMMFVVRNNNGYPYSNLRLIANIEHNKKKISTDTLNFVLAKPNGEWIGTGFGDTKEIIFQYKLNYRFPQNGNYSVKVIQAMRNNQLPGIEDIGIKIQNLKP
ncbi:gliding motility lipoprotein GldH [Epilithonimonas ginsengisoli]|uniref:Gliding motility lipoprotein GldH n=2 Tax=Chryseobacterium group TaxID=2782232 RepID=A0ABU4JEG3_9FLAO|nr:MULTISPECIES: gliding motility lipoprotein GldH [Epilithonimonas]MDW8548053.1 gliding motility lipoprotein GldH [Epilithonimonas ginsengisoli]OAH64505.1 gliding motility lipoprotein GldH [Chryseobacterium sp. FP211-J200]